MTEEKNKKIRLLAVSAGLTALIFIILSILFNVVTFKIVRRYFHSVILYGVYDKYVVIGCMSVSLLISLILFKLIVTYYRNNPSKIPGFKSKIDDKEQESNISQKETRNIREILELYVQIYLTALIVCAVIFLMREGSWGGLVFVRFYVWLKFPGFLLCLFGIYFEDIKLIHYVLIYLVYLIPLLLALKFRGKKSFPWFLGIWCFILTVNIISIVLFLLREIGW